MGDLKVCPECDRNTDSSNNHCPNCGYNFNKIKSAPDVRPIISGDSDQRDLNLLAGITEDSVLLSTRPEPMCFIYKHLMALIPVLLVIVCIFVTKIMSELFRTASSLVTSSVFSVTPHMNQAAGSMGTYSAGLAGATNITILLIAPVGIFVLFAGIGWAMRLTQLWTGTLLTLVMSSVAGVLLANGTGTPELSGEYLLTLLQWIAFLVQPFSVIAAGIVIAATEKFRRTIRYSITPDGVHIRGGIWKNQEHMIPHHLIGRIILDQDFIGTLFNYGTIIPQSVTRWGEETSFRGVGATGQKESIGVGIGYAKSREEASRYPLDCLYGIPDPKNAQRILERLVCRPAMREEEQVSYLKKIYETGAVGCRENGAGTVPGVIPVAPVPPIDTGHFPVPVTGIEADEPLDPPNSPIIRLRDDDFPDTYACAVCGKKELPPFIGKDGRCYCKDHISTENRNN